MDEYLKSLAITLVLCTLVFSNLKAQEVINNSHPSWSPDGKQIVFHSDRDGNQEIYLMNADGSNIRRLTNNPSIDRGPFWSPDGKKIGFHSDRTGDLDIYTMNVDGSNQTNLTNSPGKMDGLHFGLRMDPKLLFSQKGMETGRSTR